MSSSRPFSCHISLSALALAAALAGIPAGAAGAVSAAGAAVKRPAPQYVKPAEDRMSAMGRLAARARAALNRAGVTGVLEQNRAGSGCDNQPDCGDQDGPAGGQAELSIAVDSTGQHIVLGYN
ncbi:MAG TPA: hypothetical protein VN999_04810, partial [Thermoanaerobaculia bacterium]|nr:hypothetical protein [Thermoanaerobaculia bacterium]